MQQRKEVECMIEITIRKEDRFKLLSMELKGVEGDYTSAVPAMLSEAAVQYTSRALQIDQVEAICRIFKATADHLKLLGVSRSDLHNLVASAPPKMPDTSDRH